MSWVAVGIGVGGGALLGSLKNEQERANQKKAMLANAAQIQYSPWTHANVSVQGPTAQSGFGAAAGGALQGGLTGALIGQQLKTPAAVTAPQSAPLNANMGGSSYADRLGAQSNQFQMDQLNQNQSAYAGLQPNFYRKPAGY